ncbi:uncharacterized protein [Gossypium hirsutum]|uniref:Uncharacterized protein n=1 Tax=Gossypium hirsutum TaxID=3635 RepID=A0A1U8NFT0_GOSHI|nr:uncharacterized protein LOC107947846 [Gossypium hirsutum]
MVATGYERCVRFEDGLKDNLRVLIAPQRERDFAALVDKAKIIEEVKRAERQNQERCRSKREPEPSSFIQRPKKKAKVDGPIRVKVLIAATRQPQCTDYGRRHQGECWKRTRACLRCRSLEHHIRKCPQRSYIGSTHSHLAYTVSENLGILVESTVSEMTVLSPLGQSVSLNKLFRDVPLEVQGAIFLADLILGIYLLVKHRVSLDCATKRVVLRTEEDSEVAVIRECRNYLSNMISVLRAENLVRKGCEANLAYISFSDAGDSSVKDIKTVKDFPNVFPEELLGLPSNRKVEFEIELLPGTTPVPIAPYRMTLKELWSLRLRSKSYWGVGSSFILCLHGKQFCS